MPRISRQTLGIGFSALLLLVVIPGCRQSEVPARQSNPSRTVVVTSSAMATVVDSESPSPAPTATTEQDPAAAVTPAGQSEPGPTPSNEPTSEGAPATLPYSILILTRDLPTSSAIGGPHRLWSLDGNTLALEPLTPPVLSVTAVDVRHSDGTLAYGTSDGSIYLLEGNGRQPLIYQAVLNPDEHITISSLSFSPDGQQLAFTTSERSVYATGEQGGLWLLDLADGSAIMLAGNRLLQPGQNDVSQYREFIGVDYSPDGSALLLKVSFWEYADLLVMRPPDPDPTETNLYDPDGWWREGAWTKNSASILLTEWSQEMSTDLARNWLGESQVETLVFGQEDGLFVRFPAHLPGGIAFVARDSTDNSLARLYLGGDQEAGFVYEPAGGGQPLCSGDFVTGIDWDEPGEMALIACYKSAEIRSLDGSVAIDLTPYLFPLFDNTTLELHWSINL